MDYLKGIFDNVYMKDVIDRNKIKNKDEIKSVDTELVKVEYGMSLGAGIDISHFQISAKYFWNFGNVYKGDINKTGTAIKDFNFNGFAISVALFF